ncbi:MAG: DUF1080 domain-containing protein [Mariniphaga sp.]|nr:DUF1080 domain-containing protein [Mariniphaga sp.]
MKNLILTTTCLLILILVSCTNSGKKGNETSSEVEAEKTESWELLFDGESLDNWKIFNGGEVVGWKIADGIFENSGVGSDHGGDIITKKQYQNFELYLEWNVSPESNSGIFFHVQEGEVDALYKSGPEYQLLDDTGWSIEIEPHQYSGANYAMHIPEGGERVSAGEWNTSRLIVNGTHVEHWLNGVKVVEYELWDEDWQTRKANSKWAEELHYGISKTGSIGLQDHGGLTKFRNVKIKEL